MEPEKSFWKHIGREQNWNYNITDSPLFYLRPNIEKSKIILCIKYCCTALLRVRRKGLVYILLRRSKN